MRAIHTDYFKLFNFVDLDKFSKHFEMRAIHTKLSLNFSMKKLIKCTGLSGDFWMTSSPYGYLNKAYEY